MRAEILALIGLLGLFSTCHSLGCMKKVCGNNAKNEFRRCPDTDGSCGNYHTERSSGEIIDGVDVRCHVGEPVYAPIEGEMYFWRPYGGKREKSCADQGVRIEGTGQWQGYAVHISSVKLAFFGGHVEAGDEIGEALNRYCFNDRGQHDVEPHVEVRLYKEGKLVDPTHHLQNCMCTGQICESNSRNTLLGDPFKTDKRFNGVRGWDIECQMINDDDEDERAPMIYSPIAGETVGRIRLFTDANGAYTGCDNDGLFIVGIDDWMGYEARLYNVKARADLGFGRKRIIQGEPIATRLDCDNSPDSVFLEVRYEGRVVNITDIITAANFNNNIIWSRMMTMKTDGFRNLRAVGYQTDVPYVALSNLCWSFSCPKPGAEVEFLDLTFQLMNATGTIIPIDADIDQSIEMVGNGSADITLVTARQTLERMKQVDFTTPIGFVYYGYLLKEIPEIAVADYIIRLFDLDTLAILISFGIIIGSLVYLYTWMFGKPIRSIWDWMVVSCAGILRQFQFKISSPICALVIVGFWLWCCQVIITYYEAKLKSFLLLSHHRGTIFNTLDGVLEAAEHKGWTLVVQERGYTPYLWCNPGQCARLDRLKSKIVFIGADDDLNAVLSQKAHVGFSAVASDLAQTDITYFDFHSKILFVRDKIMAPEYLAYAVNKNIKGLREKFNRAVAYTKSGYGTVRSRYVAAFPEYNSATSQSQTATVLTSTHFMQLYWFCLIVYGIATFVLFLEVVIYRLMRHFELFGYSYTYQLSGLEWRFARPKWTHFPRRNTVILPVSRSYSPERRRVTVG